MVPNNAESPDWLNQYETWLDAWRAASGAPFAFFHFDVNWQADWRPGVESMRQALVQRGIPFGMIYEGSLPDSTDAEWVDESESHYTAWEAQGGATPNHVIFQSWNPNPQHLLPESDPTTFTHLIDGYFRRRTALTLHASSSQATGTLVDSQGGPGAAAPVVSTAQATSGTGAVSTYVLSGTVPSTITQAVIQICVNQCCDVGTNDMNVYSFQYVDRGAQVSLNFAQGLSGWRVEGSGTAVVQPSSGATGKSVRISATANQQTFVNSTAFPVTPGGNYNLAIQARISPSSTGSGYFALVFLAAGTETLRATLQFAPATVALGAAQTASDGTYSLSFAPENPGDFEIQAAYPGTGTLWPAFASGPLDITPSVRSNGIVNGADFMVEPFSLGRGLPSSGRISVPSHDGRLPTPIRSAARAYRCAERRPRFHTIRGRCLRMARQAGNSTF